MEMNKRLNWISQTINAEASLSKEAFFKKYEKKYQRVPKDLESFGGSCETNAKAVECPFTVWSLLKTEVSQPFGGSYIL